MTDRRIVDAVANGLTIVADDLTGALDTAGAFAASGPVMVDLEGSKVTSRRLCVDTDSRDADRSVAIRRTEAAFSHRTRPGLWFKKVDSLLRGWPLDETMAAFRAGGFRRILFAPAFPDTGRVTLGGRQFVETTGERVEVGPAFVEVFRSSGLRIAHGAGDDRLEACDVIVADIATNADFQAALRQIGADVGNTLFVGSGGLAAALGGPTEVLTEAIPEIAICGTAHPVTLAQISRAAEAGLRMATLDGSAPPWKPGPSILVAPTEAVEPNEARDRIRRSLRKLVDGDCSPRSAIVTGGATLRLLLDAAAAGGLYCHGLKAPGIAVSTIDGGLWDGVTIISKSGGFGPPDFLVTELMQGR